MPRVLSPASTSEREMLRQLIACDPSGLKTLAIPIRSGQGILSRTINTDSAFFQDGEAVAIYTGGRFNWAAVTRANPGMLFDEISISGLAARGISFEAMYSGAPNWWTSLPH